MSFCNNTLKGAVTSDMSGRNFLKYCEYADVPQVRHLNYPAGY